MQNLKKAALALCLAACVSVGFVDSAYAEEVMPSSGVAYEDLDREIHRLELVYSADRHNWESVTDLSLLYYDRGEYRNCYNMSKRVLKLFEDGYGYNDEDIVREALVKGAASAYNLGEYHESEKMLKKMISLNLRGSDDNEKTFMGWAYYYLSNIERIRGNYDRSHFYGNIAIHYCPHHDIFIDYWGGFVRIGGFWHWRHHRHHDYRPPMPPPRHNWRDIHPRHDVHKSRPDFHRDHRPNHVVKRAPEHRAEIHQPRPQGQVQRPPQGPVHQPRPQGQVQRPPQGPVHQPRPQGQVQRPAQRPVYQTRPQGQVQRPAQGPVHQPRPQGQVQRPAQGPVHQPRPQGQVQRPPQRPVYQQRPQSQVQHPAQRPVYQQRPQSQAQRPAQGPVYQQRPQSQAQRPAQGPVYQQRPQSQVQRPAQRPVHQQRQQGGHAPQGHQRRR